MYVLSNIQKEPKREGKEKPEEKEEVEMRPGKTKNQKPKKPKTNSHQLNINKLRRSLLLFA